MQSQVVCYIFALDATDFRALKSQRINACQVASVLYFNVKMDAMKAPNVFSRDDMLRANEAMRRQSQGGAASSVGPSAKSGSHTVVVKLSTSEINRAYALARKVLAEA
jgi:hypothetical protein